mgnify:CR=1 FL=1
MNISYNWLKEYVNFDLTPDEVAAALTSIGLETGGVEEVQTIKGGLEGIVIGEVLTCEPHPNSDHMHVTTVNLGQGEPVQIVCGAPNVAAGQKVVSEPLMTVSLFCRTMLCPELLPKIIITSRATMYLKWILLRTGRMLALTMAWHVTCMLI